MLMMSKKLKVCELATVHRTSYWLLRICIMRSDCFIVSGGHFMHGKGGGDGV
jgi:hypothetical protein